MKMKGQEQTCTAGENQVRRLVIPDIETYFTCGYGSKDRPTRTEEKAPKQTLRVWKLDHFAFHTYGNGHLEAQWGKAKINQKQNRWISLPHTRGFFKCNIQNSKKITGQHRMSVQYWDKKDFGNNMQKALTIKKQMDTFDYIEINNFCSSKRLQRREDKSQTWVSYFATYH